MDTHGGNRGRFGNRFGGSGGRSSVCPWVFHKGFHWVWFWLELILRWVWNGFFSVVLVVRWCWDGFFGGGVGWWVVLSSGGLSWNGLRWCWIAAVVVVLGGSLLPFILLLLRCYESRGRRGFWQEKRWEREKNNNVTQLQRQCIFAQLL